MKIKEVIAKTTAGILLGMFYLIAGLCISPVWLIIAIFGALLDVYEWKEVFSTWWGLTSLQWFWDGG